jgi:hypothetical protein
MKTLRVTVKRGLNKRAEMTARSQGKTLNQAISEWLESYAPIPGSAREYDQLMKRLRRYVRVSGPYTRDEMNER